MSPESSPNEQNPLPSDGTSMERHRAGEASPEQQDNSVNVRPYSPNSPEKSSPGGSIRITESYAGPVMHPRHLKQVEEVVPGSAAELIEMGKGEVFHRRTMEERESDRAYEIEKLQIEYKQEIDREESRRTYEIEKLRIEKTSEIQEKTIIAESTVASTGNQTTTMMGCGAHFVALFITGAGVYLGMNQHTAESCAAFTVVGVAYGAPFIASKLKGKATDEPKAP